MRLDGSDDSRRFARQLRRSMTPPEPALWFALRRNDADLRFRRQHPAGDYVLDFFCAPARLAIEVDGEVHGRGDRPARDAARDAWLQVRGVEVLRYPARDVLMELDLVVRQIVSTAVERRDVLVAGQRPPPPSPSVPPPPGGGG
ncbi:endonuclease domain-containing protein [Sphingomonas bacterium]|uniref:endonuclease domain-containing protein n=1 Tax=Sphingomonas bacterium TaxID=1895847 RepID=UPI001575DFB2|nr:endonuclease domain-containing protein [Sphingomonas bacterium]